MTMNKRSIDSIDTDNNDIITNHIVAPRISSSVGINNINSSKIKINFRKDFSYHEILMFVDGIIIIIIIIIKNFVDTLVKLPLYFIIKYILIIIIIIIINLTESETEVDSNITYNSLIENNIVDNSIKNEKNVSCT